MPLPELLLGMDPAEGIVAVETLPETGEAAIFTRWNGQIFTETRKLQPYLFLSKDDLLQGFGEPISLEALEGPGHYRFLALFEDEAQLQRGRIHIGRKLGKSVNAPGGSELERAGVATSVKNPTSAFLALTGLSLFRGIPFGGLRRLQIDVEAYTSKMDGGGRYYFSNAARAGDRIITIGMADSDGWSACLSGKDATEPEMLAEFVRLVKERDPDVIEVYNAGFDLRYLQQRAELHGLTLDLGREWKGECDPIRRRERSGFRGDYDPLRDAEEYFIFGRHVVDVYLSVFKFDQQTLALEGHGLKEAARYFGLNGGRERTFLEGDDIADRWDAAPDEVSRYCMDDVVDTRRLSDLLTPAEFELAQAVPAAYGRICRMGPATMLNLLLLRAYLGSRQALPRSRRVTTRASSAPTEQKMGIHSNVFRVAILSLPAALMIEQGFTPVGDELGAFPGVLQELAQKSTSKRQEMEASDSVSSRAVAQAAEHSWRSILDASLDYLAATGMPLNDPPAAIRLQEESQASIRKAVRLFTQASPELLPITLSTETLTFKAAHPLSSEEEQQVITAVQDQLETPVQLVADGRWKTLYCRGQGSLVLLGYDGAIRSIPSLRGRFREPMLRGLVYRSLTLLLEGQEEKMWESVRETRQRIRRREVALHEVARSEQCREAPEDYLESLSRPGYGRQAVYELMLRSGGRFGPGDVIDYYVTGSGADRPIHEMVDYAYNWDPDRLNIDYLLERVDHALRSVLEAGFGRETLENRLAQGEPGQQLSLEL